MKKAAANIMHENSKPRRRRKQLAIAGLEISTGVASAAAISWRSNSWAASERQRAARQLKHKHEAWRRHRNAGGAAARRRNDGETMAMTAASKARSYSGSSRHGINVTVVGGHQRSSVSAANLAAAKIMVASAGVTT